jgi:hypothetical protein
MDGQWDNAKEDLISAGLNAIPTAGVYAALAGMGKLQKAARARAAIRSAKGAMNAKDIAGSSTIRNNITGLVQEFDKTGKEISSMRPRSAAEVKAYNQNLKSQYRTGATPEGPAELMPFRSPDFAGGGMIVDPMGQWAHPGKNTRIPGDDENNKTNITMKGVNYPVLGIGSNGKSMMMYPEQDYEFGGASYVDEYPMMGKGGEMIRRADGSYSKRGLWDNIRANKGSGKKPTKQMLEQEKKIKAKNMANGGTNNPGFEALPEYVQAKILSQMGYGGYYNPYMEEGGEPNGGMALGQIMAVADKMNKLREFVSPEENLDPWIASKLAVMDDSAAAIADYMMYNPEAQGEGTEEEMGEEYEQEGEEETMANGGYVVTRSNDRKGKTHKVTGPDGTVKYFGDSKLGQHPKDPERKKAFYARHKKNLENNPFFRAFARKTWKEGGSTFSGNAWYGNGGTNNAGFKALPDYVQHQILSNMAYGGQPCYECGGMYADGGYYDCPDQEKDPVTGKCSAEVARGKQAAAANKAANADMNAWAKQVAAIDKENARQDAAQYAGQLGFDYDWMQSPVDKAEKKAAMAQYKQFFQQNPKTFVADDTSGFSPEQKYIIASKLKQKSSTPMGSKAFQQKFNQDPRFMDLGRLQSDIVPMMGGWDATRNYLFGNKEYGGIHINPANKGKFTASAKRAGMGVQEFASQVLANKEDYSSTQVKRANFARNAAGWNKADGGPIAGQEMDVTPEELEMLRQQGYQFEIL